MDRRPFDTNSALTGALLVVVGAIGGRILDPSAAHAQDIAPQSKSPFTTNNETLITSSADGLTLHFWTLNSPETERAIPSMGFHYQCSRSSKEK